MLTDGFEEILVLYGSQTGTAEAIANRLHKDLIEDGKSSSVLCMKEFERINLELPRVVVCVVSTTGAGDAPDNASKFFRFIKKRTHCKTLLMKWSFGVLGLGDTNYDHFCKAGKDLDKRLEELGGRRLVTGAANIIGAYRGPSGAADEQEGGLDAWVEPWIVHLKQTLSTLDLDRSALSPTATSDMPANLLTETATIPNSSTGEAAQTDPKDKPAEMDPTHVAPPALPPPGQEGRLADGLGRVLVLFGSQTGNAEAVAGRIHRCAAASAAAAAAAAAAIIRRRRSIRSCRGAGRRENVTESVCVCVCGDEVGGGARGDCHGAPVVDSHGASVS